MVSLKVQMLGSDRLDRRHGLAINRSATGADFGQKTPCDVCTNTDGCGIHGYVGSGLAINILGSWMPLTVVNILRDLDVGVLDVQMYFKLLTVHALAMTTICTNPLLYFWMSKVSLCYQPKPMRKTEIQNFKLYFNTLRF